jgi:hypothetical protein
MGAVAADEPSTTEHSDSDARAVDLPTDPLSSLSCMSMASLPETWLPDDEDDLEATSPFLPAIGTRVTLCGLSRESWNGKVGLVTGHSGRSKVMVVLDGMATKEYKLPMRYVCMARAASPSRSIRTVSPRHFKFNNLTSASCASLLSSVSCLSLPEVDSDEDGTHNPDYCFEEHSERLAHMNMDEGSMEEVRTRMNQLSEQVALGVATVASDGLDRIEGTLHSAIELKLAKMQKLKDEIKAMRRLKEGLPVAVSSVPYGNPNPPLSPNIDGEVCERPDFLDLGCAVSAMPTDSCRVLSQQVHGSPLMD